MFKTICENYSLVHNPISITNDNSISFEGSQVQSEFFPALSVIREYFSNIGQNLKEITFLEVGAWKGLWGMAFVEICKELGVKGKYVTLTMIDQDPNNQPLYKTIDWINQQPNMTAELIDSDTMAGSALDLVLEKGKSFDIVFIDAGHKYHEVMNDIEKFAPLADSMLLFHDIRPINTTVNCGVYEAICNSDIKLDKEISVLNDQMGIGIKFIK
jgi:hypothetical protein